MMMSPKFIDTGPSNEDMEIQSKIYERIIKSGPSAGGPVLDSILRYPEKFGIKGAVRQEILKVVLNTLERFGYAGISPDVQTERRLITILRIHEQKESGGFF